MQAGNFSLFHHFLSLQMEIPIGKSHILVMTSRFRVLHRSGKEAFTQLPFLFERKLFAEVVDMCSKKRSKDDVRGVGSRCAQEVAKQTKTTLDKQKRGEASMGQTRRSIGEGKKTGGGELWG